MQFVRILLLLSFVLSICYRWECAFLDDSQCFASSTTNLSIQVRSCPSNTKCAINQMNSVLPYDLSKPRYDCVALDWLPTLKLPGEPCAESQECLGRQCVNGECKGLVQGGECTTHDQCGVGLICSALTALCVLQRPEGAPCASDVECMNDSLCYNDKCALVMSLQDGSVFRGWISPNAVFLCQSGYINNGRCSPAPMNRNPPDFPCNSDLDCTLISPENISLVGHCYCGFNPSGLSYCQAKAGDDEFRPFQKGLLAIRNQTNKCHSSLSLSSRCPALAAHPQYESFINAYYLYYYRHAAIAIEDCVRNLMPFAQNYEYALKGVEGERGDSKTVLIVVVVVVLSAVLAAGVVCCLCVRKCAINERNQEVARIRVLRDEMEEIPFRTSQILHNPSEIPPDPANPPAGLFEMANIALHPLNRHFLQMGIPVAQRVNAATFEVEMQEEDWEWDSVQQGLPLISRDSLEATPALSYTNRQVHTYTSVA